MAKCGCKTWETSGGDTEEYYCPDHEPAPVFCPIGKREDCPHFKIEGSARYCDDVEWYCNHPDLDEEIGDEYCPIMVEEMEEEMEEGNGK